MLVKCLTGLTFEARPWNLGDIEALLEPTDLESATLQTRMLSLVAGKVTDPGPYRFEVGSPPDVDEMSVSDITLACISIRARTPPKELEPEIPCSSCGDVKVREVRFEDFPVAPYSDEAREALAAGQPVERTYDLGDGKPVRVLLVDSLGKDILRAAKYAEGNPVKILAVQNCQHIHSVKQGRKEYVGLHEVLQFYRRAPWTFQDALERDIDSLFGGVDTSIEFTCPACGLKQTAVLPLDLAFFGLDPERRQRRSQGSSSDAASEQKITLGSYLA